MQTDLEKLLSPPANGQPSPSPTPPAEGLRREDEYTASNQRTHGHWRDEKASCVELDARLRLAADYFTVYPEVWGYYTQPRCGSDEEKPRIDRLLLPKPKLIAKGWRLGAVGIEAKRSGEKIGPPIAQAMDYARAVFTSPESRIRYSISWVFIWPLDTVYGDTASLMANHCIGELKGDAYSVLNFRSTGISMLEITNTGDAVVRNLNRGKKVGSR